MLRNQFVDGLYFWSTFDKELVTEAMNYQPEGDEVIIVTYPKSGTTLMQNIVFLLKNKGIYPETFFLDDHVPFLEVNGTSCLQRLSHPRLMKIHLPFDKVNMSNTAKYIFVCRNPFDCCVSFYHHAKMLKDVYAFEGDFDEFFSRFMTGKVDYGDYFDHLNSWIKVKHHPNILFLVYEEVIKDLRGAVKKVGSFLGGEFLDSSRDEGILDLVVSKSSVSSMRAMDKSFQPAPVQGATFIRKGVKGDYRSMMREEQVREMREKFINRCSASGAIDLWRDENFTPM